MSAQPARQSGSTGGQGVATQQCAEVGRPSASGQERAATTSHQGVSGGNQAGQAPAFAECYGSAKPRAMALQAAIAHAIACNRSSPANG